MKYMVWDLETENHRRFRRFANQFYEGNWVVARGWKVQGDSCCSYSYHPTKDGATTFIPDDVGMIVGHNLKFDLLWEWPNFTDFFKRGGVIWDTQYAEYLLEAMHPDSHMNSMDSIVEKYGGRKKIDAVKALWESGVLTSQIDKDMLIDYLIGTVEEGRNSGDIGNTELIFLGQIAKAQELGMLPMIQARMDGLLALCMMEYNGLHIDVEEGCRRATELENRLEEVTQELQQYIPELPEGLTFNWNSPVHVSSLVFGGAIKYSMQTTYIDPATGELARKIDTQDWPLFNGEPVDPNKIVYDAEDNPQKACFLENGLYRQPLMYGSLQQDTYISGKKKGMGKFKKVKVPGELKVKYQDFIFKLPGYTKPNPIWKTNQVDGEGNNLYSTSADVIEELGSRDIPFLKLMAERQSISKDLGTYYIAFDEKKGYSGMLACVQPHDHIVHHTLNAVSTVTSRLSASDPNSQNFPRDDKSEVKKMFTSRFGLGVILEADYSQLEVVIQAMLTGDKNLCEDVRNKIDFHCKRVAAKFGITYEEAKYFCKDATAPDHKLWKERRTGCKEFSFQRAYGAGAPAISAKTGMPQEEVEALIALEDKMYPGVKRWNDKVQREVLESSVPFRDPLRGYKVYRRGWWQSPTGTRYTWRSYDAPEFLQKRGETDTFKPTELKNYPIQGTGGEVVQIVLGKLFRQFIATDNYGGKALLINTVHDCVWEDVDESVVDVVAADTKRIMEGIPTYLHELYGMNVTVPFPVEIEVGKNLYTKQVLHI